MIATENPRHTARAGLGARRLALGALYLVAVGAIPVGLVAYVVVSSFDVSGEGEVFRFGLDGWRQIFTGVRTWNAIVYSFVLTIRVPIGVAVAVVIAWLLIRIRLPGARFIELSLWFGFVLPTIPMTLGWILLLDSHYGLLNQLLLKLPFVSGPVFSIYSVPGIIWVHLTLTTIPIMVIIMTPALRQLDAALEEAAETAGAGILTTLRTVSIPLILPTILTAFIAGMIRSLDAFEIERIIGSPANIYVYSTRIFELVDSDPPQFPQAMALSTLFCLILIGLAIANQVYLRRSAGGATIGGKGVRIPAPARSRWRYVLSAILCALVAGTIFLPLIVLVLGSFTKLFGFFFLKDPWTIAHWTEVFADIRFARATVTSVILGLAVGLIGVFVFSLIAWVLVRTRLWTRDIASFLVWLPWGIPGIVLGLTLLSIMLNTPLLSSLYGTVVPLILALTIKEMPIGVQLLRNALAQVSVELEDAAAMAGAGFTIVFRRVTLPLIVPMLVSVFLLIFAGTIRDISTIVLIAPPGMRSLSLLMFDFAASGRLESAAVIGVLIALACLLMTATAFKLGDNLGIRH